MMRKLFRAALAATMVAAVSTSVATAAGAVEEHTTKYSTLRLCDSTVCYIAWSVIDSDHDGVCDADELQAGTNPYDPASRPGLELIAELLISRELPSFEYGLASLVAFPAEIIKAREALGVDPQGAFPLHKRADALTRMGISGEQLSKFGISPERTGFTIGLDGIQPDGARTGARVGGMDASLISAGGKSPKDHVFGGGIVSTEKDWWGNTVDTYGDGSKRTTTPIDRGVRITITDKDGDKAGTIVKHGGTIHEGNTEVTYSTEEMLDSNGNLIQSKETEHRKEKDGSSTTTTSTTEYIRDESGKLMGTRTVTTTESTSSSGATSKSTNTAVCDASGKQCTNYPDTTKYIDAEQAYNSMVTQERVDGVLRLRGAAVNVVPGWNAPGLEEQPQDPRNPATIMLVDGTVGELFVLTEPKRVTQAQPEGHPGLPSPRDAGPPPGEGGCGGLC